MARIALYLVPVLTVAFAAFALLVVGGARPIVGASLYGGYRLAKWGWNKALGYRDPLFGKPKPYHDPNYEIKTAVVTTRIQGVDLLPANQDLSAAEAELIGEVAWESTLKDALLNATSYQYIIMDCPPSLGVLTINALVAAQVVLVPLQCEFFAMRGLRELNKTIDKIKTKVNSRLSVRILRTMHQRRTIHSRDVAEEVQKVFGQNVYQSIIRRTIKFPDSSVAGESILHYAPRSDAARAYRALAKEVINHG